MATPANQRLGWRILQGLLTLSVCGGLLTGTVFFVLAALVLVEGKLLECFRAGAGGIASWCAACWFGRGVTHCRRRATDLAVAQHAAVIRANPLNALAHGERGFDALRRRDFARAIAHFDAALQIDRNLPPIHVARVNAWGALHQWQRVIAVYTEAIRCHPNDALAYCGRATAYNAIGRWDLALPDANAGIRLAPTLYLGYDARGFSYLQRGRFNIGIKIIAISWAVVTLGFWRRDRFDWRTPTGSSSDFESAIADFTEALRLNPAARDCLDGRARAYRSLGQKAMAKADERLAHLGPCP